MVPSIKKILYATDLSENARFAFGYAMCLANHHDAKITVLHIVEQLSPFSRSMVEEIIGEKRWTEIKKEKETRIIEGLKNQLNEFCHAIGREFPNCPFVIEETIVETGHPVDKIVRLAEKAAFDIVLLGSRGRGGLSDVTLGSTSRRVLRRCHKPVLIVRLPEK